jgi:deoxyribonuclease-4
MGLDAYEYSFGRGVRMKQETAEAIGQKASDSDVALSLHAPYYINLATQEEDKQAANRRYFLQTAQAAKWMGASRIVFHPGSQGRLGRKEAFLCVGRALLDIIDALKNEGLYDAAFCPETMGRIKQIGDLDEVIALCRLDEQLIPAIDFGHLHARGKGAIQTMEDYAAILDALENGLGGYRAKHFHVHFSKIEYSAAGERRHRVFDDEDVGPDFKPLAQLIAARGLEPRLICESKGTMAEDAVKMRHMYMEALKTL